MIQGSGDTRYAYVNGVIRAREARLLTRSHFNRLLATDPSSYNAILSDTPYGGQDELGAGIEIEEIKLRDFFNQYCLHDEVAHFLDWPEQMHNLKVKLKGGGNELQYKQSATTVESWPEVIEEVGRYAIDKDPFILSTNLDKVVCSHLYEAADFEPFFKSYFRIYIELENIRSFFRARQFENKRVVFNQVCIPIGRLELESFIQNLDVAQENLARNFFASPYAYIFERGGAYYEENGSFLRLERLCDEYRLGFLLQARRMTFGVEPLFSYYHFRMSEMKKLRQVYWGKLNDIPLDDLNEGLPDVW